MNSMLEALVRMNRFVLVRAFCFQSGDMKNEMS